MVDETELSEMRGPGGARGGMAGLRDEFERLRAENKRYLLALVDLRVMLTDGWEGSGTTALERVIDDALSPEEDFATPIGTGMERLGDAEQASLRAEHRELQERIAPTIAANEEARRMPGVIG